MRKVTSTGEIALGIAGGVLAAAVILFALIISVPWLALAAILRWGGIGKRADRIANTSPMGRLLALFDEDYPT